MDENEQPALDPKIDSPDALQVYVERVHRACVDAATCAKASEGLGSGDDQDEVVVVLKMAFDYHHATEGGPFIPMFEMDGRSYPPPPRELPMAAHEIWQEIAAVVESPLARARLHDLCFEARHGNGRGHAADAITAYLELAQRYPLDSEDESDRLYVALLAGRFVDRALELARRTGQHDKVPEILEVGMRLVAVALDDDSVGPGVVLGLLRPLSADRDSLPEVDGLLERARELYRDDVWNTQSTIEVQRSRPGIGPDQKLSLHRQEVEALLEAGRDEPAINRMAHLRDAAELAERHGLSDLHRSAVQGLQELDVDDLGLVRVGTSAEIDVSVLDRLLDELLALPTWQQTVAALLGLGPPTGHRDANRAVAEEAREVAPLSTLFPRVHLGADGKARAMSPGGDLGYQMLQIETHRLQIWGPVWAEALRRIGAQWAPIDEGEWVEFLTQSGHVPESVAAALHRALVRFFNEDFEAAAFTALPKIERIARELLEAAGEVVYRVPTASTSGGYVGLGILIGLLEDRGMDPSWVRFYRSVFAGQPGINLRNEALHGTQIDIGPVHAALVFAGALYLALCSLNAS